MVLVTNREVIFNVGDEYAKYSPYLTANMSFLEKTGSEVGVIEIEGVDSKILSNYVLFLLGEDFIMTSEDEEFFDFMGHYNTLYYPLDYWKVKLQSKWTRDNFYRLRLCERDNGMYRLIEIPVIRDLDLHTVIYDVYPNGNMYTLKKIDINTDVSHVVIAGGACLYMAGITTNIRDIDLFSLDKQKSMDWFLSLRKEESKCQYQYECLVNSIATHLDSDTGGIKATLIKREYACPSEVVNGFDLDASQLVCVYENDKPRLYTTPIGMYAIEHMVNWVDPEMASTTYLQRLAKYQKKGFSVRVPYLDKCNLTNTALELRCIISGITISEGILAVRERIRDNGMPHDLGSILIYLAYGGLSNPRLAYALSTADNNMSMKEIANLAKSYDSYIEYEKWKQGDIEYIKERFNQCINEWITVDPMSQGPLTGILYPLKIDYLLDILRASPLYKPYQKR